MCVRNLHLKHKLARKQAPYVVYTKSLYWRLGLNVVVIVMGMLEWGTVLFYPICNTRGHLKNKICGVGNPPLLIHHLNCTLSHHAHRHSRFCLPTPPPIRECVLLQGLP